MTSTPTLPQTPQLYLAQILNATGTAQVTVATGGTNGSKLVGLMASSTDTSAQTVQFSLVRGGITATLGTVAIPANSGTVAGTPAVNLWSALASMLPPDSDGNPFSFLGSASDSLVANLTTGSVTSGKAINLIGVGANF